MSSREEQYESFLSNSYADIQTLMDEALDVGYKMLAMSVGIVSKIEGNEYVVQAVRTPADFVEIPVGAKFELQETYCAQVVEGRKIISFLNVGNDPSMNQHPVYLNLKLESYIGAPIILSNGQFFGTLNFSSTNMRAVRFTDDDLHVIQTIAQKIADYIQHDI